jgi:putative acetyltransferase
MLSIRPYVATDAVALWLLFYQTIRHINSRDYSPVQIAAWAPDNYDLTAWQQRMQKLSPFVAEIDGVIVGYTDLQSDGLIDHFFCHYQYQGQGVGRALMQHVFTVGQTRGIRRYYSEVSITARPFYEHMGFSLVKQQLIDIRGQQFINFVMEKRML